MSTEPILELIRENLVALKKFWETEIEVKKIMAGNKTQHAKVEVSSPIRVARANFLI